ncbi:MAG TPA: hypothetical protein VFQ51_20730 [Vicinamibacteria bacterium]|nr:hypothetical protein [Vicinamibacteria bacterium]
MKTRVLACAAVLALNGGGFVVRAADPPKPCCYTNPRYSGVCSVQPGEGESCGSILEYLNNPSSQGKSYCGNTSIRGGWTQKACEVPKD